MNFLDITIESTESGYRGVGEFFDIGFTDDLDRAIEAWDGDLTRATLGIRPEDIYDVHCLDSTAGNYETIRARVKVVEPLGSHKEITFTGSEDASSIGEGLDFKARISPSTELARGDRAELAFDLDMMHIFDATTNSNITHE
jgi:multiple sugar transport system ATP-binding protein